MREIMEKASRAITGGLTVRTDHKIIRPPDIWTNVAGACGRGWSEMETDFRPTGVVEVETEYARRLKASRAEHYLYGPIRIADVQAAAKLGGQCVTLLLAIHFRRAVTGQEAVTLPSGFLSEFGIGRGVKRRGLEGLEAAKLINVKRVVGHSAVIELRAKRKRRGRTRALDTKRPWISRTRSSPGSAGPWHHDDDQSRAALPVDRPDPMD
jgi:hypothetical protein